MFGIDDAIIAALITAAASTANAAMTKPPENKMTTTGTPTGGTAPQATQDIFAQGQTSKPPPQLQSLDVPLDPMASGSIGSLLAMIAPTAISAVGGMMPAQAPQVPNSPSMSTVNAPAAPQPTPMLDQVIKAGTTQVPNSPSPSMTGIPAGPGASQKMDIGKILTMAGSAADALGKTGKLLGLEDERRSRTLQLGGAAGGQPGQSIFAMPQRQTLQQILASLPRTM